MYERLVVGDAPLQQQLVGDRAELPPRRDIAGGTPSGPLLDELDAAVEHRRLLLVGHRDRVLVAVAVDADLVPRRHAGVELLGERLYRVPGPEERLGQPLAANSSTIRGTPTSPANRPREMSSGESSPP
jgi:hypothetical protein